MTLLTMSEEKFRSIVAAHGGVSCPLYGELLAQSALHAWRSMESAPIGGPLVVYINTEHGGFIRLCDEYLGLDRWHGPKPTYYFHLPLVPSDAAKEAT